MNSKTDTNETPDLNSVLIQGDVIKAKGHLSRAWTRLLRKKIALICIFALSVLYLSSALVPILSPYGYADQNYSVIRKSPTFKHIAGTDRAGRDVLTRVIWGIQNTVILTLVSMISGGLALGVTVPLTEGDFPPVDFELERSDVLLPDPTRPDWRAAVQ